VSELGPLHEEEVEQRLARIRVLVLDVDGVLTEGGIYMDHRGGEHKRFDVRDGHGIKLLQQRGLRVAIVSGRRSTVVAHRATELAIDPVIQGATRKGPAFREILANTGAEAASVAVVGDDVVDLPLFVRCGLAITVADAHPEVRARAHWITHANGGHGAVREVADRLLNAQGHWPALLDDYLAP